MSCPPLLFPFSSTGPQPYQTNSLLYSMTSNYRYYILQKLSTLICILISNNSEIPYMMIPSLFFSMAMTCFWICPLIETFVRDPLITYAREAPNSRNLICTIGKDLLKKDMIVSSLHKCQFKFANVGRQLHFLIIRTGLISDFPRSYVISLQCKEKITESCTEFRHPRGGLESG